MALDGKDITIAVLLLGLIATILGYGRSYGKLEIRIKILEDGILAISHSVQSAVSTYTPLNQCGERMNQQEKVTAIQFKHSEAQFEALKALIEKNDIANVSRHNELMSRLFNTRSDQL